MITTIKEYKKVFENNTENNLPDFECTVSGRIATYSGEARSLEMVAGDKIMVDREDTNFYYGVPLLSHNTAFKLDPGLSGKTISNDLVKPEDIVVALRKSDIDSDSDFWAHFKEIPKLTIVKENNITDNFTNIGHDEDGNTLGNCKNCTATGVIIDGHICEDNDDDDIMNDFNVAYDNMLMGLKSGGVHQETVILLNDVFNEFKSKVQKILK